MKCKVSNGYVEVGDVVTVVGYGDESRYLYKVTGFQEYNGVPQIKYRKVIPTTLEFFPETSGSWMNFNDALTELKIIQKGSRSFLSRLFGKST